VGRVPRTYIRLTDDLALPVVTQDLMVAEADLVTPDLKTELEVRSSAPEILGTS
jgi:hypothetical protein